MPDTVTHRTAPSRRWLAALALFAACGSGEAAVSLEQSIQSTEQQHLIGYVTALAADDKDGLYSADSLDGALVHFAGSDHTSLPLIDKTGVFASSRVRGLARIGSDRFAVAYEGEGKVVLIDATGKVLARFGDGGNDDGHINSPAGLAYSANRRLYVTDKYNNRVAVFGPDGVFIRSIVGTPDARLDSPEQVAVDSQERVYVFQRGDNGTVTIFSADGALLKRLSGNDLRKPTNTATVKITAITVDPATALLYLGDSENGRIYRYDWQGGQLVDAFGTKGSQRGQFNSVSALALLADGRLAVADNDNKKIEIYTLPPLDRPAQELRPVASVQSAGASAMTCTVAYRIAPDQTWCFDRKGGSGRLLDGTGQSKLTLQGKLGDPVAAAFGKDRIAVIDDGKLKLFGGDGALLFSSGDNSGQSSNTLITGDTQYDAATDGKFSAPTDVYMQHDKVYVSDKSNRRVQIFTRDGLYLDKIANPKNGPALLEEPVAVAVDGHDNVYVGDRDLKQVLVFDRNKQLVARIGGGEQPGDRFDDIFDLEVDIDGNLYVLCATPNNDATVQVYHDRRLVFSFGAHSADPNGLGEPASLSLPAGGQRVVALYDRDRQQLRSFDYLRVPDPVSDVAVNGGTEQTQVSWSALPGSDIKAYRVYSAARKEGPYQRRAEVSEAHATLDNGKDQVYYRVSAVSGFDVEGTASEPLLDLFHVGYGQYLAREYDQALETLRRQHQEHPNHGPTLRYLGLTLMAQQQYDLARRDFEELAKLPGFEQEGAQLQVQALRAAGDDLGAKGVIDRAMAAGINSIDIRLDCGELSLALNDAIGAVQCLEDALKEEPNNVEARLLMAEAYIKLGVMDQGQAQLQQAQTIAPENPQVWRRSAQIQQQLGQHEQAIALFNKTLALAPDDLESKLALAQSHLALKQYDQVRNIAVGLTAHPETEAQGLYLLGVVALGEQKYGEALIALTKATRVDPKNAAAWLALADAYGPMKQEKMIPVALGKALEADPNSFTAASRLGGLQYQAGNYADAASALARAVALKPADYDSHYQLADALLHQDELKEAFQYAGEANKLAPERVEPLALLGAISARQGKNGAAINYLKQALAKQPNDLALQLQLGALYVDNNMFDQAKAALEKAALVDAKRAEPHALLGKLYLKRRLYDEAIAELDKAATLDGSEQNRLALDSAYAEKNKSLEFKSNAPQIVLKDLQLKQVFSAAYKQYASDPIGTIRLQNVSGVDYGNLKLTFDIKGYMDFPASKEIPELKANSIVDIPLYAAFNNKILDIDEDTGVQVEVAIKFVRDGRDDAISLTQPMTIYGKNAIVWDRPNMVGAFVTPKDDTLRDFVRQAINENKPASGPLNDKLVTAMTLFDALSAHGVRYVADPNSPYSKMASDQVDYVQFARETLKLKSGDCDDLSVLLSAALENVGIETAILDVPGHLLMMFNTGLPAANADRISLQSDLLAIRDGTVWIPVEATMIATSFSEAWTEGARKYRENLAAKTLHVIPLHKAWEEYVPVTLKPAGYQIAVPGHDKVSPLVEREYNLLLEKSLDRLVQPYRAMLAANPGNETALMQIAIVYARNGLYDKAFQTFDQLLEKNPQNGAVYNNRGNIFFSRGEFDRALKSYERAEQIDAGDAGVKMNLAMTYYKLGKLDGAKGKFAEAVALNKALGSQYADFARLLGN